MGGVSLSRMEIDAGEPEFEVREAEIDGGFVSDFFGSLPEGFLANALALTSPRDACRLSLVGSVFRSAAEWDVVWESFLPPDYQKIMADACGGASIRFNSKKELYFRLCDRPLVIDGGNKSVVLEKASGKKCFMLAARDLSIVWGDTPRYWRWISVPESRFAEVAELISVCWLEVHGKINTSMLSTNTTYAAYLVFRATSNVYGFQGQPIDVSIGVGGVETQTKSLFVDPEVGQRVRYHVVPGRRMGRMGLVFNRIEEPPLSGPSRGKDTKQRGDGWLEIEVGEYFNRNGDEGELEMSIMEIKGGNWKGGLVIQGIEIRPKASK